MRFNRTIKVFALTGAVGGFSQYPVWILLALYLSLSRHLSDYDIALIFLAPSAILSPVSFFGGRLVDRIGRRPFLRAALLGSIVAYAVLFVAVTVSLSLGVILVAMILTTILGSLQNVAINAVVTDISTEEQRLDFYSLLRVAGNTGTGVGLVFAGVSAALWPGLFFLLPAIGSAISALLIWSWVPETRSSETSRSEGHWDWVHTLQDRKLVLASLLLPLSFVVANQWETPMMPIYLTEHFGIAIYFLTLLYAINTMTVVATQFLANRASERIGAGVAFSLGLTLYAASDIFFWLTGNLLVLAANIVLLTTGENLTSPYSFVIISKIAPSDRRGEYFGASQFFQGVIGAFSPFIGTFMLGYFAGQLYWMWGILAGACLTLAIVFIPVSRWFERPRAAVSVPSAPLT